jgi:predicted DCC family thiol-disulfide oxidoreductase YuxK
MAPPAIQNKALVLYDAQCQFCQKSVAILKRLDWFGRLTYQNGREVDALPTTDPPLIPERLLEEMHVVTPDRRSVYHGFGAFRWMAWRLPLCWLVVPFLYIPGVPWLGNRIYRWIARNRFKIVPCDERECELPRRA